MKLFFPALALVCLSACVAGPAPVSSSAAIEVRHAYEYPAYQKLRAALFRHAGYEQATYFPFSGAPSEAISERIFSALDGLTLKIVYGGDTLPDPGDKGVVALENPDSTHTARLALQIIKTGELFLDAQLLRRMDDQDTAALFLHEALIRLWYQDESNLRKVEDDGTHSRAWLMATDRIADIVNTTMVPNRLIESLSAESVSRMMCDAGFRVGPGLFPNRRQAALPSVVNRKPVYSDLLVFENRDCSVRHFQVKGPWSTDLSDGMEVHFRMLPKQDGPTYFRAAGKVGEWKTAPKGKGPQPFHSKDPSEKCIKEGDSESCSAPIGSKVVQEVLKNAPYESWAPGLSPEAQSENPAREEKRIQNWKIQGFKDELPLQELGKHPRGDRALYFLYDHAIESHWIAKAGDRIFVPGLPFGDPGFSLWVPVAN